MAADDHALGALEEAQLLARFGGAVREMGVMGIPEMNHDPDVWTDDAGQCGHFSRLGDAGFHEVHVGFVVHGPQRQRDADLAVPAAWTAGSAAVGLEQGMGPLLDGGFAVGPGDAHDSAGAGESGQSAQRLQGQYGVGNPNHGCAGEGAGPIHGRNKAADALGTGFC